MSIFRIILLLSFSLLSIFNALGQDNIYTKQNGTIKAKVMEIDRSTVKYKNYNNLNGPLYTISRYDIYRIEYENGTEDVFAPNPVLKDTTMLQYKRVLKVQPFAPYLNYIAVGYEQLLNKSLSLDISAGFCGINVNQFYSSEMKTIQGGFLKTGLKIFGPSQTFSPRNPTNPMITEYIRIDLAYSNFSSRFNQSSYDYQSGISTTKHVIANKQSFATLLNLGIQFTFVKRTLLDFHFGLGFANSTINYNLSGVETNNDEMGQYFSHFSGPNDLPYAISFGWKFGFFLLR